MTPSRINSAFTTPPEHLLRLLHRVAFVSTLLILSLSASGIYWVYERYVIKNAESEAVSISQSILALEQHRLLRSSEIQGVELLLLDKLQMPMFDQAIRKYLEPYNILKIKIFSPTGEVVYSTDRSIIGQRDHHNQRLAMALAGRNDSKLQTKEEVYDLQDEKRFDIDVVETYVPIRNSADQVVGSFEIYQDTTAYRNEVIGGVVLSVMIIGGILGVVFCIAYLFLRTAVNRLSQAQSDLRTLATLDGLTGLVNHREIVRIGKNEFARYTRQHEGQPIAFSLIMADIDHFKQINDRFGHLVGDEVLREVAQRINHQMRRYSVVGRYGGEEFLVVLPEADSKEAHAVAERIRAALEADPVDYQGHVVEVTISLGTATVLPDDGSFESMLQRADNALYHAKSSGRNTVSGGTTIEML